MLLSSASNITSAHATARPRVAPRGDAVLMLARMHLPVDISLPVRNDTSARWKDFVAVLDLVVLGTLDFVEIPYPSLPTPAQGLSSSSAPLSIQTVKFSNPCAINGLYLRAWVSSTPSPFPFLIRPLRTTTSAKSYSAASRVRATPPLKRWEVIENGKYD